jgi:osmotically-inducible protein OsmY
MNGKPGIAAILAGLTMVLPAAFAEDPGRPTMELRAGQVEARLYDAWLDGKLETALLFNVLLNAFDIRADVRDGTARLSGAVESDIDRSLAGEIAASVKGVNSVRNDLVVDESRANKARDTAASRDGMGFRRSVQNATLKARVRSELLVDNNSSARFIAVDSHDGEITLTGKVRSEEDKQLAARIARNTSGAKSVNNELQVANGGSG